MPEFTGFFVDSVSKQLSIYASDPHISQPEMDGLVLKSHKSHNDYNYSRYNTPKHHTQYFSNAKNHKLSDLNCMQAVSSLDGIKLYTKKYVNNSYKHTRSKYKKRQNLLTKKRRTKPQQSSASLLLESINQSKHTAKIAKLKHKNKHKHKYKYKRKRKHTHKSKDIILPMMHLQRTHTEPPIGSKPMAPNTPTVPPPYFVKRGKPGNPFMPKHKYKANDANQPHLDSSISSDSSYTEWFGSNSPDILDDYDTYYAAYNSKKGNPFSPKYNLYNEKPQRIEQKSYNPFEKNSKSRKQKRKHKITNECGETYSSAFYEIYK